MRERVNGLGGELEVASEEGVGTQVRVRVALPALTAGDAEELSNA
jgi:signal transduction histidine kinase